MYDGGFATDSEVVSIELAHRFRSAPMANMATVTSAVCDGGNRGGV